MSNALEALKLAREGLRAREWPKSKAILVQMFPNVHNSKFVGDLLKAATAAQRTGEQEQAEQCLLLAIEIYESGRDENVEVVTAIKMLSDILIKAGKTAEAADLRERTFLTVLTAAEGLLRSIKSLQKQLQEAEKAGGQRF